MIKREALIPASVLMTVGATFVGAHVVDRKTRDIVPVVTTVRQDTAIGKPLSRAVKHTFPVIDRENIGGRSVPVGVLPVDTEGLKRSLDDAEKKIAATGRSETLRKEVLDIRSSVDSGIIAQDELGGARQIRGRLLPVITAFGDEHDRMVRRAWGDVGYIAGGVLLAGGSILAESAYLLRDRKRLKEDTKKAFARAAEKAARNASTSGSDQERDLHASKTS